MNTVVNYVRHPIGVWQFDMVEAEITAGVVIVNEIYSPGIVDRYGNNTTPGTTDMTTAIQAAVDVAHQYGYGGEVHFLHSVYRTTSAIVYPLLGVHIAMYGYGAVMQCDHNGDGIYWVGANENYTGHSIHGLTINGPNEFLPTTPGYVPPSAGSGIQMNRDTTDNIVTAYNNTLRDVIVQGFQSAIEMRAVIGLNVFGCVFQFNTYGVFISGGQTNANHFFGTHIRYNRVRGIYSDGTTGGSLSNATFNNFKGCLIESNIAYVEGAFPPGGTPPNNTAIYLANSYNFSFEDCYIENHSASVYLTDSSKFNKWKRCVSLPGGSGTRLGKIYLDGAGVYSNEFDIQFAGVAATEEHVVSNNANQLYNTFGGSGIVFLAGSILANLDYHDVKPDLNYVPSYGVGLVRMPSQGYAANVAEGTNPGQIDGIGTGSGSLNAFGLGEIVLGNGITGTTTIDAITRLSKNSLLVIRSAQATFAVTLLASAFGTTEGQDVVLDQSEQQIVFWVGGDGFPREIARNFTGAPAYMVTNPTTDRALNVTADTTAQVAAVLGTLIADLKTRGIIT